MDKDFMNDIVKSYKQQDAHVGVRIIEKLLFTYMEVRDEQRARFIEERIVDLIEKMGAPVFTKD